MNVNVAADLCQPGKKAFVLVAVAILALAASACTSGRSLPAGARQALEQQWDALGPGTADLRIVRAWKGKAPSAEPAPAAPAMQIWCVEAEPLATPGSDTSADKTVWIVTRPDKDSPWATAMLFTMSSLWPYQACGLEP